MNSYREGEAPAEPVPASEKNTPEFSVNCSEETRPIASCQALRQLAIWCRQRLEHLGETSCTTTERVTRPPSIANQNDEVLSRPNWEELTPVQRDRILAILTRMVMERLATPPAEGSVSVLFLGPDPTSLCARPGYPLPGL